MQKLKRKIFVLKKILAQCNGNFQFILKLLKNPVQRKYVWRWIKSKKRDYLLKAPSPWVTFDSIEFIQKQLPPKSFVFEYGSGGSTLFWLKQGYRVISVENNFEYFSMLKKKIGKNDSLKYFLIPPAPITEKHDTDVSNPDNYLSSDFSEYSFMKYVKEIDKFPDNSFDLVMIDGRARPSCIKHSCKKVKIGGLLILDNSDRKYYLEKTEIFLKNYTRSVFVGSTPGLPWFTETTVFTRIS